MHKPSLDKDGEEEIIKEVGSILEGDDLLKQIDQRIKFISVLEKFRKSSQWKIIQILKKMWQWTKQQQKIK